jgi:hypothetical protein
MLSPPIALFMTTIASQQALRKRQGLVNAKISQCEILMTIESRIYPSHLAGQENTLHCI